MTATIRKKASRTRFVVIDQDTIRDKRLSWKARGLLAYLLSLPDDWEISFRHLMKESPHDKATALRSAFKELMTAGYAGREVVRSPDQKRAQGTRYFVTEECLIARGASEMQETDISGASEMQETCTSENLNVRKPESQETYPLTKDLLKTKDVLPTKDRKETKGPPPDCRSAQGEEQPWTLAPTHIPEAVRTAKAADNHAQIQALQATVWPADVAARHRDTPCGEGLASPPGAEAP